MEKLISKSIVVVIIAIFISGCAFHSGYMSNSAALNSANFSYVKKNLRGEASATYIFGFGGLGKETLVDDAKQQMLLSEPLYSNQALVNLSVNYKSTFYLGVYKKVTCTVTADIVEFREN